MKCRIQFPNIDVINHLAPLTPVIGCKNLLAHQSTDFFDFWDEWEQANNQECPIPFWISVWPGAALLAHYLQENPAIVSGKTVLDLGCGGGVAGIAAASAGASAVVLNDIDAFALKMAQYNATANQVVVDIDSRDLTDNTANPLPDVILVADMFYERAASRKLADFLKNAQLYGADILVADGQRPFSPKDDRQILCRKVLPVNNDLEGVSQREVTIFRLPLPTAPND